MRKIGYYVILIIFLILIIPVIILGGVDSGIKIPGIINRFSSYIESLPKQTKYTEENGGPKIKVYVEDQKKIVEMYMEEYLKGVVAAEMPVSFNEEALKAQAVAARTFAYSHMIQNNGTGCTKHPGSDVCSGVHCQAWMSKEERFKNWNPDDAKANWDKIAKAVDDTKDIVLTYKGELAKSILFHSTSGGKTENCVNVFGYDVPYLVSVASPNEEEAPSFQTKVVMKREEFIKRIKQLNSKTNVTDSKLSSSVKILEYTEGGRVKTLKVGDKTFSGVDIRWAMGLNSANFSISIDSKNVTFNVKGYGHGVGMSQWGANEMGKRGKKYDEILKHYYTGIEIININDILKNKN